MLSWIIECISAVNNFAYFCGISFMCFYLSFIQNLIFSGKKPSPMWDRLVFNKIKDKLGGRVRLMTSGASPLSPDVLEFLRV